MYDNWLFHTLFPSLIKKRKEERENEVAKPVLNHFYKDPIDFTLSNTKEIVKETFDGWSMYNLLMYLFSELKCIAKWKFYFSEVCVR